MGRLKDMTHAAVYGPRGDLAKKVERPLAKRTPASCRRWTATWTS